MKQHKILLYAAIVLLLFGVTADSCEKESGVYFRINRHGEDRHIYGALPTSQDYWGWRHVMPVQLHGTAIDAVLEDHGYYEDTVTLRRINGRPIWSSYGEGGLNHRVSWDGNYIYSANYRRHLSDFDLKEVVIPDSLVSGMEIGSISNDNRYICYSRANSSNYGDDPHRIVIVVWDDLNKIYSRVKLAYSGDFGGAVFVPHLDKICYVADGYFRWVGRDGSSGNLIYLGVNGWGGQLNLLPGEESCLMVTNQGVREYNFAQDAFTRTIPGFSNYCYAPHSRELYLIQSNTVSCYHMDKDELRVVYRGDDHDQTLGYGFGCSMDGNYIFLGARKK